MILLCQTLSMAPRIFELYDNRKEISARGVPFESPPFVGPVPSWHFESINYIQMTFRIKQLRFSVITRSLILKCFVYSLEDRERDLHGGVCTRDIQKHSDMKAKAPYHLVYYILWQLSRWKSRFLRPRFRDGQGSPPGTARLRVQVSDCTCERPKKS